MEETTIKKEKTPEEELQAAKELVDSYNEKKLTEAQTKLFAIIKAWEEETGCTFVITGMFSGNKIDARLEVIYNSKQQAK